MRAYVEVSNGYSTRGVARPIITRRTFFGTEAETPNCALSVRTGSSGPVSMQNSLKS
jgi:hypothetical protein